ncbi:MAG: alkyl sulfatase C-terminal domain-containing protein [Acidimicrobiales bacterium]
MGAQELRTPFLLDFPFRPNKEAAAGMNLEQVCDYFAIRLNGPSATALGTCRFNWEIGDDVVRVELSNGVLHGTVGRAHTEPDAVVRCERAVVNSLIETGDALRPRVEAGEVQIDGEAEPVLAMWDVMDHFPMFFPIVEP